MIKSYTGCYKGAKAREYWAKFENALKEVRKKGAKSGY